MAVAHHQGIEALAVDLQAAARAPLRPLHGRVEPDPLAQPETIRVLAQKAVDLARFMATTVDGRVTRRSSGNTAVSAVAGDVLGAALMRAGAQRRDSQVNWWPGRCRVP